MPELPEVETIARTLAPQVQGSTITGVQVLLPKSLAAGAELLPCLEGATIERICRRAKLLLVGINPQKTLPGELKTTPRPNVLPNGLRGLPLFLAFHLKMTGRFFVHPAGTKPLPHTRIIVDLDYGRLFFDDTRTFGYCRILRPEDFTAWDFWQRLGPEPLETAPEVLAERLRKKHSRIKAALLDQSVVAGVGNIYADESLFRAGIRPDAKASAIPAERLAQLARCVQEVLAQSIEECGSSIRDYRDAKGNAGAFQNSFAVYGQKGRACQTCQTPLETATIAGRTTVYCPHCQLL